MVKATFLGHACWAVREGEREVLIDPFLTGNPQAAATAETQNPTAILVSHAHNDHVGDAAAIARRSGAVLVSNFEIASYFQSLGLNAHGMHLGGAHTFDWGWVKLTLAFHGSTLWIEEEQRAVTLGNPCGFLLRMGGKTIYHAGDTALFGDMALLGRRHPIDLALLPIGDNYTMGIDDAVEAVRLLQPAVVVPMHYNTFPPIVQDPEEFARKVRAETSARPIVVPPGQSVEL
jgi:L-ascorbate metabolism protein UlaG (beta-lactamase superfamily)